MADAMSCLSLRDLCAALLRQRLGLAVEDMVREMVRLTKVSAGKVAFFSADWSLVSADRSIHCEAVADAMPSYELTIYVPEAELHRARVAAAVALLDKFKAGAHAKLGYTLTDRLMRHIFGHAATTIKTALGLGAQEATKRSNVLAAVEKICIRHIESAYEQLPVELAALQLNKSSPAVGGGKRVSPEAPTEERAKRVYIDVHVGKYIDTHVRALFDPV